jgi:hypothetical protein
MEEAALDGRKQQAFGWIAQALVHKLYIIFLCCLVVGKIDGMVQGTTHAGYEW